MHSSVTTENSGSLALDIRFGDTPRTKALEVPTFITISQIENLIMMFCVMSAEKGCRGQSGGMTEKIRFDNLAPFLKKILKGSERPYTDAFKNSWLILRIWFTAVRSW